MRYFVRTYNASGHVEELEVWNGPYGFESEHEANEDILDFISDAKDAYDEGFLDSQYDRHDFFVEAVEMELPYNGAD